MNLRLFSVLLLALARPAAIRAQQPHEATGIVLRLDRAHRTMLVSCDEIAGYMEAMKMPFVVPDWSQLRAVSPGTSIRFTFTQRGAASYATSIHPVVAANLESEPMQAASLATLQAALDPPSAAKVVTPGQHVPDFELIDQAGSKVRLSSLAGKVVLLTFGYSRCPNPDYCVRLSSNLAHVRSSLPERARHDLVLITIAIDPEHDQGDALRQYAAVWKADPAYWHFLTGPLPQIKTVAAMFGMNFWSSEGLLTHPLHTVVIDRAGNLAANLEGNQFRVPQLADLVETVMERPDRP